MNLLRPEWRDATAALLRLPSPDPDLAAFDAAARPPLARAARVLSVPLAFTPESAVALLDAVDGHHGEVDSATLVDAVLRRPFVRRTLSGCELSERARKWFSAKLRAEDRPLATRLHEMMLSDLPTSNDLLTLGQRAYYMAAINETASLDQFRDAYLDAPAVSMSDRIWICDLVDLQEAWLAPHNREFIFFRAFRLYNFGYRAQARQLFEQVIAGDHEDFYMAVSLHLLGRLLVGSDKPRALALLSRSIEISDSLKVHDNALMARNSLAMVGYLPGEPAKALRPAREAYEQAQRSPNRRSVVFTATTLAIAVWYDARERVGRALTTNDDSYSETMALLDQAYEIGVEENFWDGALHALNAKALFLRQSGEWHKATAVLEMAVDALGTGKGWGAAYKIEKTMRGLRRDIVRVGGTGDLVGTVTDLLRLFEPDAEQGW